MLTTKLTSELMGPTVRSSDGEKLGKIGHIFLDDRSGWLEWVTVSTGLFGQRESFSRWRRSGSTAPTHASRTTR